MLTVLAQNLKACMNAFPERIGTQDKVARASRGAINQKTVSRILREEHAVTLDTLAALSAATGTKAYQLLIPGFDAKAPLVVLTAQDMELEIARRVKESLHKIEDVIGGLKRGREVRPDRRSTGIPDPDSPDSKGQPKDEKPTDR